MSTLRLGNESAGVHRSKGGANIKTKPNHGGDENPNLETLKVLIDARLADGTKKKFKLWFNSHSSVAGGKKGSPAHMRKIEKLIKTRTAGSKGRLQSQFLKSSSVTLTFT